LTPRETNIERSVKDTGEDSGSKICTSDGCMRIEVAGGQLKLQKPKEEV